MFCSAVVGASSISSSSSTRGSADSAPAANPPETVINGSLVVAVGMPLATASTVAAGLQNLVMVSYTAYYGFFLYFLIATLIAVVKCELQFISKGLFGATIE